MNSYSITNIVGYAKIIVVLGYVAIVALHSMTFTTATELVITALGFLSATGSYYSADKDAPMQVASTTVIPATATTPAVIETRVSPDTPEVNAADESTT